MIETKSLEGLTSCHDAGVALFAQTPKASNSGSAAAMMKPTLTTSHRKQGTTPDH